MNGFIYYRGPSQINGDPIVCQLSRLRWRAKAYRRERDN